MRTVLRQCLIAAAACVLSACVPVLKTVQPQADIVVQDLDGRPIEGASVHLVRTTYPHGPREIFAWSTGVDGIVRIPRHRQWVVQVLIVDGIVSFGFGLCVDKPGFRPFIVEWPDFAVQLIATLEPADAPLLCAWPEASRGPPIAVPAG